MFVNMLEDARHAIQWLRHELQHTWNWLRAPSLLLTIGSAVLLLALAYQSAPSYRLAIGGDSAARLRHYDDPFLFGFNAPEPDPKDQEWWEMSERPYRWSMPEANLRLPAVGGQDWQVMLTLASGQPDHSQALAEVSTGTGIAQHVAVLPGIRRYQFLGKTQAGDLIVGLRSAPFAAPNDARSLGVVVYTLAARPLDAPLQLPAAGQMALHAILVTLVYCVVRCVGLSSHIALLAGVASGLILAGLLVYDRLGLTITTPRLVWIMATCLALVPILAGLLGAALKWLNIEIAHGECGHAIGIVLAAFAVRMVGVTHPYAQFSDLRFNANNLIRVIRGEIFLVAGLPCDAGAGSAPYPPAQYLALAPIQLLLTDLSRSANDQIAQISYLILGSVALLESLGAALLWLLLRKLRLGRTAAIVAAVLYVLPVPLLRAYTVGEMSNLFGQALVPLLLLLLSLWPPASQLGRAAILAAVLIVGLLLAHTGVTISAACLIIAWFALQIVRRQPAQLVPLGIAVAIAGIVAFTLFYSAYAHLPSQNRAARQELADRKPALICPAGRPFGEKLLAALQSGFGIGGTLSTPLVIAAAAALFGARRQPQLRILLAAAVAGTFLSFATLLNTDQPVRWAHFLFPAICLGAGVSIAVWAQRGRAGIALMLTLLSTILWFAAADWIHQISRYLH